MSALPTGTRAEIKRRRLLEAGLALLDELAYPDITVSLIAERAAMARGLIFYYFGDKDAFFSEVIGLFFNQHRASFRTNDPLAAEDPLAWLEAEVDIFLDIMTAHPRAMRTTVEQAWLDAPDETGATMSDFTARRVREAFRLPDDDYLLDAALHSWGHHSIDLVARVQQSGCWNRRSVGAILVGELRAILAAIGAD